jgi:amino acid permease
LAGFYTLTERFLDPSFAFAMGWNYVLQWAVVLPLEITVAVTTVKCVSAQQRWIASCARGAELCAPPSKLLE